MRQGIEERQKKEERRKTRREKEREEDGEEETVKWRNARLETKTDREEGIGDRGLGRGRKEERSCKKTRQGRRWREGDPE